MVITDVNQVVYQGDGVTTAFPFTFRIIDATDIKLLLIDADGTETDITSDYFVDTVNSTVHYPGYAPGAEPSEADRPAPVQEGQRLVVYRELPVTQEKDLGDKWPFFVIELALDKLTMLIQQVKGIWDRCLKVSVGQEATAPDFNYTVPIEAGKTFRVKDDGTGFELTEDPAVAHAAAVAAQEAAERAQGFAEDARDDADEAAENAEAALDLIKEKATWFDNVATMKAAAGLQVGMLAGTKGYYSINDGGSSIYAIRAKTQDDVDDGGSVIFLDNGNVAELITDGTVSVKQFGAVGDGITDDTNAFRNAFAMPKLYIPAGNYLISEYLIGTNEVEDEGTYVNLKPIFKMKDRLKSIEQFALTHEFNPTGSDNMYGECMTFDTKRQKIILCFYWYTSPVKNVFLVLNKDTYAVEQTIDAPYPYAFNALSYNDENDTVIASGGNTAYVFDAGDLSSYTTILLPNSCSHYTHDNVTGVDVVSKRSADSTFDIYVYTNNLETLLKSITTGSIRKDTAFQDCCAYNGKLYLCTWLSLFELDLATENINEIGIGSFNEFEGIDFVDDVFFAFEHQAGSSNVETIYRYIEDGTPQFYERLSPNNIKTTLDVSLDNFVAMGQYYVQTTDSSANNYPYGETKGYLLVTNSTTPTSMEYNIIQEFRSLTFPYNHYYRLIARSESGTKSVSVWKTSINRISPYEYYMFPNREGYAGRIYLGQSFKRGTIPSSDKELGMLCFLSSDTTNTFFALSTNADTNGNIIMRTRVFRNTTSISFVDVAFTVPTSGDCAFYPTHNIVKLGLPTNRWKQLYAATATIDTSDERVKDNIETIPDEVLDAWEEVQWQQFQFKDAIAQKGDNARIHTGAIAQRIRDVFKSHGLDAFRYGLLCYDSWEAEEEQKDEDGNVMHEARPAGDLYSLRYEEALCMEAAYQRRRADRLEERITRLEAKL